MSNLRIEYTKAGTSLTTSISVDYEVYLTLLGYQEGQSSDQKVVLDSTLFAITSAKSTIGKNSLVDLPLDYFISYGREFSAFFNKYKEDVVKKGKNDFGNDLTWGLLIVETFNGSDVYSSFSNRTSIEMKPDSINEGEFLSIPDYAIKNDSVKFLTYDKEIVQEKQVQASKVKEEYENTIKEYQAQLVAQAPELLLTTQNYEPLNVVYVITRLLEFQEGTLNTSMDFALNANLDEVYSRLKLIDDNINSITGLSDYSGIDIEQGEGIPYGDGIPAYYKVFGWFYDQENNLDSFNIVNKDGSSVSNYAIITRNGQTILDTRDFEASLSGFEYFTPSDYIGWGEFCNGDVILGTVYMTAYSGGLTGETINFDHSGYGYETDYISSGVTIGRNWEQAIFNTNVESGWDDQISPSGTTWNSEYTDELNFGWNNLGNVTGRTYGTFYEAFGSCCIGSRIIGRELVMHDETTDEYWAIQFSQYGNTDQGAPFSYTRQLIIPGEPVTYNYTDTLVWKDQNPGIFCPSSKLDQLIVGYYYDECNIINFSISTISMVVTPQVLTLIVGFTYNNIEGFMEEDRNPTNVMIEINTADLINDEVSYTEIQDMIGDACGGGVNRINGISYIALSINDEPIYDYTFCGGGYNNTDPLACKSNL